MHYYFFGKSLAKKVLFAMKFQRQRFDDTNRTRRDMMTRYVLTTIRCYFTEAQDILLKYRHLFTRFKVISHFNYA